MASLSLLSSEVRKKHQGPDAKLPGWLHPSSPYRCHDSLGQLSRNILPLDKGLLKGHHPDGLQKGNLHSSHLVWALDLAPGRRPRPPDPGPATELSKLKDRHSRFPMDYTIFEKAGTWSQRQVDGHNSIH